MFNGIEEDTGLAIYVRYSKSFTAKLTQAPDTVKGYYTDLKNAILSYKKTTSRISWQFDSINSGRQKLIKYNVRGKTLYIYFALNPDDYAGTKYKVERTTSKKYEDVPCLYRIRNERRAKNALDLITVLAEKFGLIKGEVQNVDYRLPYETTE